MLYRYVFLLLPALLSLSLNSPAQTTAEAGQESTQPEPVVLQLSLKKAVDIALSPEGNTRVRIAEELVHQAKARSVQARAAILPHIGASVGQQSVTRNLEAFGIQVRVPGLDFPTFVGPYTVFDARATAGLDVLNLSSIRRYQASRENVRQSEDEREYEQDQVRDTVVRIYLSCLKARAGEEAARSSVALAEKLLVLAENRKNAGAATGIEITRARVQLANERQRLLFASNETDRTHRQLLRALGLDLYIRVEPVEKMAYESVYIHDPRTAVEIALESRADWKAQLKREESARLNHSASRFERLPSVSLFADYGTIGSGIDNAVPTRTYGFSVKVPIFEGGRLEGMRAESSSMLRLQQERTQDLRDQIELEILVALDSLQSADLQVAAAREGLQLAEKELAQAERRYEAGIGSSIEVTDAQTRLERARDNNIQALFIHNIARIDLHSAMGTIRQIIPGDDDHDQVH